MPTSLPFLTAYDPPGTSEGTLDPLGLYQIADQLAVQLVPAVRERMQRARFLTAMTVGALIIEGMDSDPRQRDSAPYLVWEWHVIEALLRNKGDDDVLWGVPGSQMARRAISQHGYLDARSYLKTPRIFGFHGVYKRLAIHLGLVDVHLGPGPNAELLVDAWARDQGLGGLAGTKRLFREWADAVERALKDTPPRTRPRWNSEGWAQLAAAFSPDEIKTHEKNHIRKMLIGERDRKLGALPELWGLMDPYVEQKDLPEEELHRKLEKKQPAYGSLIEAIRTYETFARSLTDAFEILRAEASRQDVQGFAVTGIATDADFRGCVNNIHQKHAAAYRALAEVTSASMSLQNHFGERFADFGEPLSPAECGLALCALHEAVQRAKSETGKRPWFDRMGNDRIYVRQAYRSRRPEVQPGRYVHPYRGWPIHRFYIDVS